LNPVRLNVARPGPGPRPAPAWLFSLFFVACATFTTCALAAADGARLKAGAFSPPALAPEFALRGSDDAELNLARYRGKVVLLSFGFTHCTEVCPVTLATLAQARKDLGANAAAMQVVYVTVDPERDDAGRMKAYLSHFDPSFVGGTGRPDTLAGVRKNYGIAATRVAASGASGTSGTSGGVGGYAVDHSSSVYLIDAEGRLRAMMPYGHSAADYVHDVRLLLKK
jgi:protein SCO1